MSVWKKKKLVFLNLIPLNQISVNHYTLDGHDTQVYTQSQTFSIIKASDFTVGIHCLKSVFPLKSFGKWKLCYHINTYWVPGRTCIAIYASNVRELFEIYSIFTLYNLAILSTVMKPWEMFLISETWLRNKNVAFFSCLS